jgi:hypothetical protein
MKRIILDHFRRWWLVLTAILIAYFVFQALSIHENNSQTSDEGVVATVNHTINTIHNIFVFQAIMFLGFLLVWDIQRGLPRILTSMPVTTRQIGHAWWLASVAFPAIALGAIGLLAIPIFSGGTFSTTLLGNYLTDWIFSVLYLGAIFGALTFMATTRPDTFMDKTRTLLPNLLFPLVIMGLFFIQLETLTLTKTILIFAAYVILSVVGWFRAERMVLQRVGFSPTAQSSNKKTTQHKIPQGLGGLPYLAQKTFIQTTLIGLAIISWMALWMSFFHLSHGQNRAQAIGSMIDIGSIPYVFVLLFFISPVVFQLRFLRTLPISPAALAVTLVCLPVFSIAAVGMIVIAIVNLVASEAVVLHTVNGFLMLGAEAAVMVSLIVWRGLDSLTYLCIFLMVISGSLIKLGMTIIFHLGSKTPERPWWINLTIFLLCVVGSLALTQRLLAKSSSAYRVRTMPANAWSMARR